MARRPPPKPKGIDDDLQDKACRRLQHARQQKNEIEVDLREAYFFAAPRRARSVSSETALLRYRPQDSGELNTSFAMEMAGDFATVVVNTFFPQGEQWAMRKAASIVPDETTRAEIEKQAVEGDTKIFAALNESNFYAEVGKGFTPDLAIGTIALWQEMKSGSRPMRFMSVPIRELEINIGPFGEVDDRFVVRHTRSRNVPALLPGIALPREIQERVTKGDETCEVTWGFWRIYEDDGEERWQHVVMVDDVLVDKKTLVGEGSCPLIVARFAPTSEYAWAAGPLLQALPDLRMVDELAMKRIRAIDLTLEPPVGFPDDSFANVSEGLEAGMAYPIRPGSEDAIKNIYDPPPQDAAVYFTNDLETRIKRIFFLDYPDQPGKTPPTATQWLDEMTMAQRRIGTPGLPFWWEFCAQVFTRAEFLLKQHGLIKPIQLGGKTQGGLTKLRPYNPAEKAIEQQKVAQFARFVQIAGQAFPEEFKLISDGTPTVDALARIMGVDDIWKERPADAQKNVLSQLAQLKGGAVPGAPVVPDSQGVPQPDTGQAITPQVQLRSKAA